MKIQLSDHFNYQKLLRFTMPSIVMMIFTSVYGIVDGFFVSNFVGKTPFTAVNLIMPFLMILGAVGFMFGAGGSALIAKTLGEGDPDRANRLFSLFVYVSAACGVVFMVLGLVFLRPVAILLGAEGAVLEYCVIYGRIVLLAIPAYLLQFEFQSFFVTAEKPQLGLAATVASGLTNMVLDAVLVAVFPLGLQGAALATAIGQCAGGVIPVIYFCRPNSSLLRLGKTKLDCKALGKACTNGSSEFVSNISMSVVSILYNIQLLRYAGEDGVAAYGVLMYVNLIFLAAFLGYSVGTAPVIGYHYGAGNDRELKGLLKRSLVIVGISSVAMLAAGEVLARPLSQAFVGYDQGLMDMTLRGFVIYSFSFLFAGVGILGSSFFTALNNGLISALLSFLRTLVFQVMAVLILPLFWELDGIWMSMVVAELLAAAATVLFLAGERKRYHY